MTALIVAWLVIGAVIAVGAIAEAQAASRRVWSASDWLVSVPLAFVIMVAGWPLIFALHALGRWRQRAARLNRSIP